MSGNAKQRLTLTNLTEPQQMRELNRQLSWIWDQLLGGLSMKSLNEGTRGVIESKADGEVVIEQGTQIEQTQEALLLKADRSEVGALGEQVAAQAAALTVQAGEIAGKVSKSEFDGLGSRVESAETALTLTATKAELTSVQNGLQSQITAVPGQIELAVSGIKVGGRNLLRHTKPIDLEHYSADSSGASAMGTVQAYGDGLRVINVSSNFRLWLGGKLAASGGQSFTVSYKFAMLSGNSPLQIQANYFRSEDDMAPGYADSYSTQKTTMVEGGWGWVQATFVMPEYCHLVNFALRSGRDFELYTCEYLVKELKIELGTTATDWSPAPEDAARAGGRNYLRNTGALYRSGYGVDTAGTAAGTVKYHAPTGSLEIINTNTNTRVWMKDVLAVRAGEQYTISTEYYFASGEVNLQFLMDYTKNDNTHVYRDTQATQRHDYRPDKASGWTWVILYDTFTVPEGCTSMNVLICPKEYFVDYTNHYYIRHMQLESGNQRTDWRPAPEDEAKGLNTGESGVRVVITDKTFDVDVPDEYGDFHLGPDGARMHTMTAQSVSAPNVMPRYDGPATVWINPNATGEQVSGGAVYRSLADLFARLNGRMLDMDLTVHMQGNDYGALQLARVMGGSVAIYGNGVTLAGTMIISDCAARVYVHSLNIVVNSGQPAAAVIGGGTWVQWNGCVFNSGGGATYGLMFYEGGRGMVLSCGLYNATNLMYVGHASDVSAVSLSGGGGTNFAALDGCTIKFSGTRPDGAVAWYNQALCAPADPAALPIDYGSAQPSVPVTQTGSWGLLNSDTYGNSWSFGSHDDLVHGWTSGGGRLRGCMWFDNGAMRTALSGKTVKSATLRLTMWKGVGRGVDVTVELCGTALNASGHTGSEPAVTKSYGVIGTTQPGQTATMTIPVQAVNDLVSGAINGLMLYSSDTEGYKGRVYSKNYARFDGQTSGNDATKPVITVVYQ